MCSLIGTCLTLDELKKIQRRNKVTFSNPDMTAYELHAYFVKAASKSDRIGRALQAMLERKYRLTWKQFAVAETAEELDAKWREALSKGDIAGPYWAVLAHPLVSLDLENRIFGEVHMLSHLVGATNRSDLKMLRKKGEEVDKMREELERTRCDVWSRDRIVAGLRTELDHERRSRRNATFNFAQNPLGDKTAHATNMEATLEGFRQALDEADKITRGMQDSLARKGKRIEFLEAERARLQEELTVLEAETRILENTAPSFVGQMCDNDGGLCPGEEACPHDLCRKRVLYVGGRATLVSRYRDVVEGWNGEFLHHDGGQEQSFERLGGLLEQADVVVFPADCVSHTAVAHIKNRCTENGKRMMAVRSSGLGAFMHGLQSVAAHQSLSGSKQGAHPRQLNVVG